MGTWTSLTHQPNFGAGTMLLLTDGTVMCQESGTQRWHQFTPDKHGSYRNGTWSPLASGPNAPLYFASAVLPDGRVFVAGGEYEDGISWDLLATEVYNPQSNFWSIASLPAGWTNMGDAPSCMLPDGRLLVGSIMNNQTAIYDLSNNTWRNAAAKVNSSSSEETWTLLPDETILAVNCPDHPGAQKYIIAADKWIPIDPTPSDLVEASSIEIGPAILLPDGRVFATGATGHTALYKPAPIASQPGTWTLGPDFPPQPGHPVIGAKDAPASLLPNGKVLRLAGPVDGIGDHYLAPMFFFEFDPVTSSFALIGDPPSNPPGAPPFVARLLLLPNGEVLFANGTSSLAVYDPGGGPATVWRPTIIEILDITGTPVTTLTAGGSYTLVGRQLNGLSQAVSYGDDAQMATNYPLVRVHHGPGNRVTYCRTQGYSTMGVATGTAVHTAEFQVPGSTPPGSGELRVVANGIESSPLAVTIA
jgi:hypothetical protein